MKYAPYLLLVVIIGILGAVLYFERDAKERLIADNRRLEKMADDLAGELGRSREELRIALDRLGVTSSQLEASNRELAEIGERLALVSRQFNEYRKGIADGASLVSSTLKGLDRLEATIQSLPILGGR